MICCEWPFSLSTASSGLIRVVACVSAERLTPFSAWVTPVMWVFPEFISHPSWALGLLAPLGCVDMLSGCGWTEACLNSASLLLALHRAVGRLGPAAVAFSVLRPPRTSAQPLHFSCPSNALQSHNTAVLRFLLLVYSRHSGCDGQLVALICVSLAS